MHFSEVGEDESVRREWLSGEQAVLTTGRMCEVGYWLDDHIFMWYCEGCGADLRPRGGRLCGGVEFALKLQRHSGRVGWRGDVFDV